jgi:hypothetical protein
MSEALAEIGHNRPPPQSIFERLADDHKVLQEAVADLAARADATRRTINSKDDLDAVGIIVRDTRLLESRADKARVTEKEPFLSAGREVDAFFKVMTDRLGRISQFFRKIADDYQRAVVIEARRKAEEEARKARAEEDARLAAATAALEAGRDKHAGQHTAKAEEAGQKATQAEATANAGAAELTRQRLDSGVLATSKEEWTFEITDLEEINFNDLKPYFKHEHIEQAIRAAVKLGRRSFAGVRIFKIIKANFR